VAEPLSAHVVIVGSGVAGMLAAYRLAQAGVRVVVLEAGPPVVRSEALANYRNAVAKTPESPYPDTAYAPRPSVLDPQGYYVQEGPDLFKSTYARRVGGTTWHWLGTSLRHLPNDFRLRSLYNVAVDWPISYDELEPWYLAAEQELGVAGDSTQDLGSPRSGSFPMKGLPLTYLDKQVALGLLCMRRRRRATHRPMTVAPLVVAMRHVCPSAPLPPSTTPRCMSVRRRRSACR
jgi:choline dehydrogenase-like flavoprotein